MFTLLDMFTGVVFVLLDIQIEDVLNLPYVQQKPGLFSVSPGANKIKSQRIYVK